MSTVRKTAVVLLVSVLFWSGWRPTPALHAEEPAGSEATHGSPFHEKDAGSIPPLPFDKATMDLPRIREERENAAQPAAAPAQRSRAVVARNGKTALSLDVETARKTGAKWIEVDLSEQKTYAYEGDRKVNEFLISSGVAKYPTVQGVFRIWVRVPKQTMSGGSRAAGNYYSLPNVQWVQYFYQDYAFHGTYWHNNFGTPMSHGCINMTIEDAEWLFRWAMPDWDGRMDWMRTTAENATLVWVHE